MSVEKTGRKSPVGEDVDKDDRGVGKDESKTVMKETGKEVNGDVRDSKRGEEGIEEDTTEDDQESKDGKLDLSNIPVPNDDERNQLFEEGLKLDKAGKSNEALKYYLKCLVGLKENSKFALLPQCLRNIGDIYYGKNEYDKAISFIQAEKLYYETVLVDSSQLQRQIDEISSSEAGPAGDVNIDLLRATEYEQLAKLCMDEKQPQLALEYAGKATKLRQKVYGDGHPEVQKSLDYFAEVYAEVGKHQYSESLTKFDPADIRPSEGETSVNSSETEPVSILRRRKVAEGGDKGIKHVSFDESLVHPDEIVQREEKVAQAVLTVLFVICLVILFILGLYLYCNLSVSSGACLTFRHSLQNFVMKLRYWWYHYSSSKDVKYT